MPRNLSDGRIFISRPVSNGFQCSNHQIDLGNGERCCCGVIFAFQGLSRPVLSPGSSHQGLWLSPRGRQALGTSQQEQCHVWKSIEEPEPERSQILSEKKYVVPFFWLGKAKVGFQVFHWGFGLIFFFFFFFFFWNWWPWLDRGELIRLCVWFWGGLIIGIFGVFHEFCVGRKP